MNERVLDDKLEPPARAPDPALLAAVADDDQVAEVIASWLNQVGVMVWDYHLVCRPACLGLIQDLPMGMRG